MENAAAAVSVSLYLFILPIAGIGKDWKGRLLDGIKGNLFIQKKKI